MEKLVLFESYYVDGRLIVMNTKHPQSQDGAVKMIVKRSEEIIKDCERLGRDYLIIENGATNRVISINNKGIEHSFRLTTRL